MATIFSVSADAELPAWQPLSNVSVEPWWGFDHGLGGGRRRRSVELDTSCKREQVNGRKKLGGLGKTWEFDEHQAGNCADAILAITAVHRCWRMTFNDDY